MAKVFVDTSVFIRFLTKDDIEKYEDCREFLGKIEEGQIRPYISNIVVLEIQFVLIRGYKFPKKEVLKDIEEILSLRNLTLIERSDTKKALSLYKKYNIKYPDCLISLQCPEGAKIVTYDEDFAKLPGIHAAKPADFLKL